MGFENDQVATALALDFGGTATGYTDLLSVGGASGWAVHIEWTDDDSDFAVTPTLWASNKSAPDQSDDSDWVEMTAEHGWKGFVSAIDGGDGKELADVSASGALFYRLKFVATAGSGTINAWYARKLGS